MVLKDSSVFCYIFLLSFEGKLNDTIKELIVEKLLNPRVAARGDTFCIYGKIRF